MNLIIVNPCMDDFDSYVFGVCSAWVRHLAPYFDKVFVITFKLGKVELPSNVEVFEVKGKGQVNRLVSFWNILGGILKENKIGAFFSHMEQNASLAATPLLRIYGVPHYAWYARESHGAILNLLEVCADHIVTSSPQGCRIKSKKVIILQQGVDCNIFIPKLV
jgi:hypothetical protein